MNNGLTDDQFFNKITVMSGNMNYVNTCVETCDIDLRKAAIVNVFENNLTQIIDDPDLLNTFRLNIYNFISRIGVDEDGIRKIVILRNSNRKRVCRVRPGCT